MKLLTWLLDLLFPPKCIICHRVLDEPRAVVCPDCLDALPNYEGAEPHVRYAERCVATFFYQEPIRASILRFKFGGLKQYAEQYGKWMAVTIGDKLSGDFDLVTWAPVSDERRKSRGYDQTELLCRAVSETLGVPMLRTLVKTTHTPAQSTLQDAAMRAANVRGVYEPYQPEVYAGKRILLLDDIVTTGATLSECSRVLLTAGAERVLCAALAAPAKKPEDKGETL